MKKAIFAGSFDPIQEGHLYIIKEALKKFDFLYVVVAINWKKRNKSSLDKRFQAVKKILKDYHNVEVLKLDKGLIAKLAQELKVNFLIRGIRNNTDQVYEDWIRHVNLRYNKNIKTFYIKANKKYQNLSSSQIRSLKV